MKITVLIIDNDRETCDLSTGYLSREGFGVEIAESAQQGLEKACSGLFDVVLLDAALTPLNGFEVLRGVRARSDVPVVMLGAGNDDVDKIVALEVGADDYLTKPFNFRELLARLRAILRRTYYAAELREAAGSETRLVVGDVEMNTGSRSVRRAGEEIELTALEFNLLEILLRSAGRFVLREELIQTIFNRQPYAYDRSIDVHVSKLRKKLGHKAHGIERIKTIRNVGYLYSRARVEQGAS
jgi:two-component system response regulator CpxR